VFAGACPYRKRLSTRAKASACGPRFAKRDDYVVLIRRGAVHFKRLDHRIRIR
jgi:hypothetical protein